VIEFWFEASHGLLRYFLRADAVFAPGVIDRDARFRHDCESLAALIDAESYEILKEERGRIYVRYTLRQAEGGLSGTELANFDARTGALLLYGGWSPPTYPGAMSTPDAMPPVAVVGALQVTATVTMINYTTREVTLASDDGHKYSFFADEEVENFAQVKKGDIVTATYAEALAYQVLTDDKPGTDATLSAAAAQPGTEPDGNVGGLVERRVKITAIDPKVPSITFQGPDGETRTIKLVSPSKLQGVTVGDTVELTYSEAIADKIEPKPKK
jgi:hypothetical protein